LTLLKLALPTFEAIGALALYLVARKGGLDSLAGVFAVALYLAAPLAFITFGWGVYANLFAQQVLVLTLAVWLAVPWVRRPRASLVLLGFFLVIGILSHASMLLSVALFWGVLIALSGFFQQGLRPRPCMTALDVILSILGAIVL
jgi:hypothetical protein